MRRRAITLGLLSFSDFCTANYGKMLAGAVAAVGIFRAIAATKSGRIWWDRAKMKIPLIGPIVETRFYAGFTQALGNLIINGVPLLVSLKLLIRGTPNRQADDGGLVAHRGGVAHPSKALFLIRLRAITSFWISDAPS